jgi:hypothetical protein
MRKLPIALVLVLACSCASTRFSAQCDAEMNRCIDGCARQSPSLERQRQMGPRNLPAELCEQHCAEVGRSCQEREAKLAREQRGRMPATPVPTAPETSAAQ